MAITGIEKEYKCHISITEEKDAAQVDEDEDIDDKTEDIHEPVPPTRMMAQARQTDV